MVCAAFDLGNVLFKVDFSEFLYRYNLANHVHTTHWKHPHLLLNYFQHQEDLGFDIETILFDINHQILSNTLPDDVKNLEKLKQAWNESISLNETMWSFIQNLQFEGVKIALLSNIGPTHTKYILETYPEVFKNTIAHLSFEVGARKPSKLYYQSFLMDNKEFLGSLFIDDKEENLKMGKKYGFTVYNFSLERWLQRSQANQKKELDLLKSYIFNRNFDGQKFQELNQV